jgi:hypothetical protein
VRRNTTSPATSHANIVGSISVGNYGIASLCNIYSSNITNYVSDMNWFISNNVNVINMSWGSTTSYGSYLALDAFMDYHVRFSLVTIVKSAGNRGDESTDTAKVSSPGNGYNVITVGASDVNKEVASFSSYISNNSHRLS